MAADRNLDLLELSLLKGLESRVGPGLSVTLTDNRKSMISVRRRGPRVYARISRLFALAGEELVDDLALFILGHVREVPRRIRSFIDNPPVRRRAAGRRGLKLNARGACHDLNALSKELDRKYFDGLLKPRVTWGKYPAPAAKRRRSIQYGSYDEGEDVIRVHPGLDSDFVPREFLELVIFHEMLHKKIGAVVENGGRRLHTKEFRALEKTYEGYEPAAGWERDNFGRLLALIEKEARRRAGRGNEKKV